MTFDQEMLALKEKQEREVTELMSRWVVLGALPDMEGYAPPFVHHGKLYGSVGLIQYQQQRYRSIAKGKSPDAELLKTLLTGYPPVDMLLVRGGCTSIRPEPESYENNGDKVEIDPVTIELDPRQHGASISVNWYAMVGEGNGNALWRFEVEFPYHNAKVGTPNYRWERYGGTGEVSSVKFIRFKPVPERARFIKWAGGSSKDPGHITLYWERGDGPDVDGIVRLFE